MPWKAVKVHMPYMARAKMTKTNGADVSLFNSLKRKRGTNGIRQWWIVQTYERDDSECALDLQLTLEK